MNLNNVYELYKKNSQDRVLFSFKGTVTPNFIDSMLSVMETKLDQLEESPKTKKKVYNVMVECLQNLYHHAEVEFIENKSPIQDFKQPTLFLIAKKNDSFHIKTGNYIDKKTAEFISEKIDFINQLDEESLKSHYQKILVSGEHSSKGTAGLGFIDITRKSGNKLGYEIISDNESNLFFYLNVRIN